MEIITIMILFVAVVLGVTFIPRLFSNEPKQIKKTKTDVGTKNLDAVLKAFARRNEYKYLPACHFEKGDASVDVNGMIIAPFGVLAVVATGRNGEIFGSENESEWVQVTAAGKTRFENPIETANLAVRLIREPLMQSKVRNVVIECVPVFTDTKVNLAVPRSCNVYKMKDLKTLLLKDKYQEDKSVDIDAVYNALSVNIIK